MIPRALPLIGLLAYLIPPLYLMDLFERARDPVSAFHAVQEIEVFHEKLTGGRAIVRGEYWARASGEDGRMEGYRRELELPGGKLIKAALGGSMAATRSDKLVYQGIRAPDWIDDLFGFRSREALIALLAGMGVDTARIGLTRAENAVAYIIGAREGESFAPQMWLDKETFMPIRIWLAEGKALREIRLDDYRDGPEGGWYPRKITFQESGRILVEIRTLSLRRLRDIPDATFDPAALSRRYPSEGATSPPPSWLQLPEILIGTAGRT